MTIDEMLSVVRGAGGVMRGQELIRRGASKHLVARAVGEGRLQRVRRTWVAVPEADPYLLSAARHGVVVTCATRLGRLGAWVLKTDPPHVAAPPHAGMVSVPTAVVHRHRPLIPRLPDALEDAVENALALVARCLPQEQALAIFDSARRLALFDPLVFARLDLDGKTRAILALSSDYRDSGLETFVFLRLRFLRLPVVSQVWLAGRPVDFLIGERLVLQIDGGHHVGAQRAADNDHDARLALMGYHVIRVTYGQVVDHWPTVLDLILRAVAQGLHRAS